jgi:hypothetical protein
MGTKVAVFNGIIKAVGTALSVILTVEIGIGVVVSNKLGVVLGCGDDILDATVDVIDIGVDVSLLNVLDVEGLGRDVASILVGCNDEPVHALKIKVKTAK